jgi:hypothetical protein
MPDRDYSHRSVVDKLGIKPGHAVVIASHGYVDDDLRAQIRDRVGRNLAEDGEKADVILVDVDDRSDPVAVLAGWKRRLIPAGGIWLLSRKRGRPGYLDQRTFIDAGGPAGLVDNKICSVSDTITAMRFVIRRRDRVVS